MSREGNGSLNGELNGDRDKNEQGGGWNLKGELNLGVMKARKKGLWAKGRV